MTDKAKIRIVVDEDTDIVARIDSLAEAEGLSRSDILRRAIRRLVFSSSTLPDFGNSPKPAPEPADVSA